MTAPLARTRLSDETLDALVAMADAVLADYRVLDDGRGGVRLVPIVTPIESRPRQT